MKNNNLVVVGVTFALFTTEALLHYNLGAKKNPNEIRSFVLPPPKDFAKLAAIVAVFSLLSGAIINQISK